MAYSKDLEELLNRAYRYSLSLSHNEDMAFDMVQNAYLKICEEKKPLIISYLITTIRNSFIDQKRKQKTKFKWLNSIKFKKSYEPTANVEPNLEKLLAKLKDRDREILLLAVVEEYTAKEIGELLDMPRNTILTILSRTKKKLKSQLQEKIVLK